MYVFVEPISSDQTIYLHLDERSPSKNTGYHQSLRGAGLSVEADVAVFK